MLKSITLNRKKIPVPIPLTSLREAIAWVESDLLTQDRTITQVTLDGEEIELVEGATGWDSNLSEESKLFMRIDSPWDLSLQTLDAVRNLVTVLEKTTEPLVVKLWTLEENEDPPEKLGSFLNDLDLILDLTDHLLLLVPDSIGVNAIKRSSQAIQVFAASIQLSLERKRWKELVKKMVNGVKPKLGELAGELDGVQRTLFELQAQTRASIESL